MSKLFFLTGLFALLASTQAQALSCSTGYEIFSDILTETRWESTVCPEDDGPPSCLRTEGVIFIFSTYTGMI